MNGETHELYVETKSFFNSLEMSDWKCELFGMGPRGITFHPLKGKEPNWFWRWMQYLCFGNRWIYDEN